MPTNQVADMWEEFRGRAVLDDVDRVAPHIAQIAYYAGVMDLAMKLMRVMMPGERMGVAMNLIADIGEEAAVFLSAESSEAPKQERSVQ